MGQPLSMQQPFRKGQLLVGAGWRGFFATYNAAAAASAGNTTVGPNILDLQVLGPFDQSNPPTGYTDLGWISKFKITPGSKIGQVRSGYRGAVRAQYRGEVGEVFEFSFNEMGRMQYKIATGTELFNILANPGLTVGSSLGPLASSGAQAVPMGASGYQTTYVPTGFSTARPTVFVPAGSGALFPVGSTFVCDQDYTPGTYGLVGAAGINTFPNSVTDIDYIRKTSDYVARVIAVIPTAIAGQDALVLNKPFVGGGNAANGIPTNGPTAGAKLQLTKGYIAREGGTFIMEWSALFVMNTVDGSQLAMYYPHVSPNTFKDFAENALENAGTTDMTRYSLDCSFTALAYDDPLDGETVVRYSAYYPAPNLDPQI